ncbi:MAG: hypothetical protein GXP31_01590 [Kiritimatiellaeota bacterium]|nr:hypothetical protein [Kiritimatiellota bacterium]
MILGIPVRLGSLLAVCGVVSLRGGEPRFLLKNPGFETPARSGRRAWKTLWGQPENGRVVTGGAHTGKHSLLLNGRVCVGSPVLDNPGGLISVSGWIRTESLSRGERPWDAASLTVAQLDRGRTAIGYVDIGLIAGTHPWSRFSREFVLPACVRAFQVRLEYGRGCRGRAWFDDIQVVVRPDPYAPEPRPFRAEFATVRVDSTRSAGALPQLWRCIDNGPLNDALVPRHSRTFSRLAHTGFRLVRFHECLAATKVSRDERGASVYDWGRFDAGLEPLLKLHMRPMVVLEGAPASIAREGQGRPGDNSRPDLQSRRALTEELVRHCVDKYGLEEVRSWYFEVRNETDGVVDDTGSINTYLALYDYTVAGAVRACPQVRIGGPGSRGSDWVERLAEHCADGRNAVTGRTGTRIDFFSWHIYCGGVGVPVFSDIQRSVRQVDDKLKPFPKLGKLPRMITEWSCNRLSNPWLDDSYRAPFILKGLLAMDRLGIDKAFTSCIGDSLHGRSRMVFRSGLGLFTAPGFPKAPFHVFEFLDRLRGARVAAESSNEPIVALAAWDADRSCLGVIVGNYVEDPRVTFSTRVGFRFTVPGFAGNLVRVQVSRVTPSLGNAYDDWVAWERPQVTRTELLKWVEGRLGSDREKRVGTLLDRLTKAAGLPPPETLSVRFDAQGAGNLTLDMPLFSVFFVELSGRE